MLAPPAERGYRAPDPTKLKNRRFASGRAADDALRPRDSGVGSIWTETPEEKARRLADAVLGRGGGEPPGGYQSGGATTDAGRGDRSEKGTADEERIRSYTEQTRGKSLYDEHQARRKTARAAHGNGAEGDDEDDPSKRAFDKEKDMALGSRITNSQRLELLDKAANFGARFQKGSYL
jgi:hypothetical protein